MACEKSVLAYFIKCSHVRPEFLKLILPNNNPPELLDFIGKKKKNHVEDFLLQIMERPKSCSNLS